MRASEFCYWLQGLFELDNPQELNERQTTIIKRHLALVFLHDLDPKQLADKLQQTHDGNQSAMLSGDGLMRC